MPCKRIVERLVIKVARSQLNGSSQHRMLVVDSRIVGAEMAFGCLLILRTVLQWITFRKATRKRRFETGKIRDLTRIELGF